MDKEALELVMATGIAAAGHILHVGDSTVTLVPPGYAVQDLEAYAVHRDRFRGHFFSRSLCDFAAYIAHHAALADEDNAPPIFVDQASMSATVFFDLGSRELPGHCEDSATLTLTPTACYTRLQDVIGKPLTQAALIEWLEDWSPNIMANTGTATLTMGAALAALRRMKVSEVRTAETVVKPFYSSASTLDEVEASSMDVLPTDFIVMTAPYDGLRIENFTLQLNAGSNANGLFFKLRWRGEEAQREDIAKGFKRALDDKLGATFPLIIGAFRP